MDFENETFIAHTLRGEGFDASEDGTGRGTPLVVFPIERGNQGSGGNVGFGEPGVVRRLTPLECERLQGMQDGQTAITQGKPAADGPRYKAIGNSWAVNVARWVGERIALVDAIEDAA
jgi:DNA (cytosine-5)-methyltransferase 1